MRSKPVVISKATARLSPTIDGVTAFAIGFATGFVIGASDEKLSPLTIGAGVLIGLQIVSPASGVRLAARTACTALTAFIPTPSI